MRVLVVEDEELLAAAIGRGLRAQGMAVDVVHDGAVALEHLNAVPYDVCVLDRDLPAVNGDDVCREVQEAGWSTRILMLTASTGVSDRVAGLDLGADDYLGKPFAFSELAARVRALDRRRAGPSRPTVLVRGDLRLDVARRVASRGDRELDLAPKELAVLEVLLAADGGVVSAEELLDRAWDASVDPFTNTVRVTVMNLRRKLGDPPVVRTVVGAGYRL